MVELERRVREDFTIIEKASSRALTWLKVPTCLLVVLSHKGICSIQYYAKLLNRCLA